ncbi:MAG: hypothetical protein ABIJ34_05035 [archaeon]
MRNNSVAILVVSFLVCILLLEYGLIYISIPESKEMTSHVATVKFCNNHPPSLYVPCNITAQDLTLYTCQINASDADNTTLIFDSVFVQGTTFFWINSTGAINFTANQSKVGNYTIWISVSDNTGCDNAVASELFNLEVIHVNHAPVKIGNIPNQEGYQDQSFGGLYLGDYFYDPDGDSITFQKVNDMEHINTTITGATVSFSPIGNWYGTELITFMALDPYLANVTSNNLSVTIKRKDSGASTTSSGGGGGGGFSSNLPLCLPDWHCIEWGPCEPDNLMKRECSDLNNCSTTYLKPNVTKECEYISTCYDGFKGKEEEGTDCGGVCPPCGNCYDSICNNNEECLTNAASAPDCGGPCQECSKIRESCYDGKCNNNEDCMYGLTDIPDCGGSCGVCPSLEQTLTNAFNWGLWILVGLSVLLTTYTVNKTYPLFILFFKKRKKKIYEDRLLLETKITESLLDSLAKIEAMLDRDEDIQKIIILFSQLVRKYFKSIFEMKYEFTYEEMIKELNSRNISETYKKVLKYFFLRSTEMEYSGNSVQKDEVRSMISEFRTILSLSSKEPLHIEDKTGSHSKLLLLDMMFLELSKAESALRSKKLNDAFANYLSLYEKYQKLKENDKLKVHGFLTRLYEEIRLAREEYDLEIPVKKDAK